MSFDLEKLVRENVKNLTAYSSARQEFAGAAQIFLDANENSFGSPVRANLNRYPDPLQLKLKRVIVKRERIAPGQVFLGNGSDEAIDLLFRAFCEPRIDEAIITPPTYGMYEVSAAVNDVKISRVALGGDFRISSERILGATCEQTKITFLCSPNNPTGNLLERTEILKIAEKFSGIVVVDEAYVHFSGAPSLIGELENFPNLVVLQTFSKAWGLAGLRIGAAFASAQIIEILNRIKPPYNVGALAQEILLEALENENEMRRAVGLIVEEREQVREILTNLPFVERVYPSDANFLLVKMSNAAKVYRYLLEQKIVVRNRSNVERLNECLRITVGTPQENEALTSALKKLPLEKLL